MEGNAAIEQRGARLNALTSLRFFAAAMIVVLHSRGSFVPRNTLVSVALGMAVSFFFVLSGFILTHVYPSLARSQWTAFLRARVARLWPAYATAIILALVLVPGGNRDFGAGELALAAGMLQSWVPVSSYYYALNGPAWSVATEFAFYFGFLFLIIGWRRTWHVKLLLTFAVAVGMLALSNRIIAPHSWAVRHEITEEGLVYINPLARIFEFGVGMATALLYRRIRGRVRIRPIVGTLIELAVLAAAWYTMSRAIAWAAILHAHRILDPALAFSLPRGGILCIPFAAVVLVFAMEIGYGARLLSLPPFRVLGEISYSVYLLHQVILRAYWAHTPAFARIPYALRSIGFVALVLVLSYAVWAGVERPCRRLIVQGWRRFRAPNGGMRTDSLLAPGRHARLIGGGAAAGILLPILVVACANVAADRPIAAVTHPATTIAAATFAPRTSGSLVSLPVAQTGYSIDSINNVVTTQDYPKPLAVAPRTPVVVNGWAIDESAHRPEGGVSVLLDGTTPFAANYGIPRPALAHGDAAILQIGFRGVVPPEALTPGQHTIRLLLTTNDKSASEISAKQIAIRVDA